MKQQSRPEVVFLCEIFKNKYYVENLGTAAFDMN